ncbi:DUF4124 domain-containing protein [Accumulibacter sp.]|uniref:DUF4124 domain-containing protein n=1 Tax=Accumulibacter sp. TaxID=2053492 RepID=UPI0025D76DF8|nr:DUF4124 domain-containing protein [Accumulibacter sp.]MCM8611216.1 DUF4124 domain-containing protein [Accumulibacter sp.]MCM8634362.1 DUF4124 domain-containing protein [Accumulibacter sp.]MCM8641606.1 DUF4124 domain-containing protein [Accumulibacter sp.]
MKRFALAAVTLATALAAQAQVYQWQDEQNRTVISDRPPSGPVRQLRRIDTVAPPSPPSEPAATPAKTLADRDMEFRKRQQEARDAAEKSENEQRANARRREDCEAARKQLRSLESGERIFLPDGKGGRYPIDDSERAQVTARMRDDLQRDCK